MSQSESRLAIITHPAFLDHPVPNGHPERPQRIKTIWQTLDQDFADIPRHQAPPATDADIALVHSHAYLNRIIALAEAMLKNETTSTTTTGPTTAGTIPLDADTHIGQGSLEAARRAVGGALLATDLVLNGTHDRIFLAARPPGHHAEPHKPMGFCIFSAAAIAAQYARAKHNLTRVAVVDFDVHHGNGTQAAFWNDGDLIFASSHQMPLFPGTGAASETGRHNNIHNAPLKDGDDGDALIAAWKDTLIPKVKAAKPELIIISAGFDAHKNDPLAGLNVQSQDFETLTTMIRHLAEDTAQGRIVSLLEGGYDLTALKDSSAAHLNALR